MKNAILSHINLNDSINGHSVRYNDCVSDLKNLPEVLRLDNFSQHMNTSRLQHSVNVSYYSYLLCRFLRFNYRAAARAGLLHDFYHYDWRDKNQKRGQHAKAHPKAALENAKRLSVLSSIEEDAIINHMWPITLSVPKYKETYIVSLMDKYCACFEVLDCCRKKVKRAASIYRKLKNGNPYAR